MTVFDHMMAVCVTILSVTSIILITDVCHHYDCHAFFYVENRLFTAKLELFLVGVQLLQTG